MRETILNLTDVLNIILDCQVQNMMLLNVCIILRVSLLLSQRIF